MASILRYLIQQELHEIRILSFRLGGVRRYLWPRVETELEEERVEEGLFLQELITLVIDGEDVAVKSKV